MAATRKMIDCPIFGSFSDLSGRMLPTYEDMMKCYLYERHQMQQLTKKDPAVNDIANIVSKKIESLWKKASIPCVSHDRIKKMILDYHKKYRCILKPMKCRKDVPSYKRKCDQFRDHARKTLFDASCCKCKCFTDCLCLKERKVPKEEQTFLTDQRTDRKMVMSSIDVVTTKRNKLAIERKSRLDRFYERQRSTNMTEEPSIVHGSSSSENEGNIKEDQEFTIPKSLKRRKRTPSPSQKHSRKNLHLPALASACDRTSVSDRAAAIIASSVLHDIASTSEADSSYVIDRSKVRRERLKQRKSLQQSASSEKPLLSIYFDGRKDTTLIQEQEGNKYYRKRIQEEHISLVEEPGSKYMGHLAVKSGSAREISDCIAQFIETAQMKKDEIKALGCDGTAVNTGQKGGVIRLLETKLGKPFHWFICQLHANELPLRHLIENLDGKTGGPRGFVGEMGKKLEGCEKLSVVEFEKIPSDLPTVDRNVLSTDQKYLYDIHHAVSSGDCSKDLALRNPGKLAHSRWLTTANRILRLYVSTKLPSESMKTIVQYVMKVYAPMWFTIKTHSGCEHGSQNVFKTIELSRSLKADIREIVYPVIQRNAFFAHPENVLLGMMNDDRSHIRELAWRRTKRAREQRKGQSIRIFKIPVLNFDAKDYTDIINWHDMNITEPPLTYNLSDKDIDDLIESKQKKVFANLPCHTQAVERVVKLVTKASSSVCGIKNRDGLIRARIESRKKMPTFESKAEFCV